MRAFLAVHLDAALRSGIAALQDDLKQALARTAGPKMRITWVKLESSHLTVKFLGELDEAVALALRGPIATSISGSLSMHIPIERLGAFPRQQAPRSVWAGPSPDWERTDTARQLQSLVRRIDASCSHHARVPEENHPWRPHLTLVRVRDGDRAVGRALGESGWFDRPLQLPPLAVRAVSLMRSELLPDGPRHTTVWTVE